MNGRRRKRSRKTDDDPSQRSQPQRPRARPNSGRAPSPLHPCPFPSPGAPQLAHTTHSHSSYKLQSAEASTVREGVAGVRGPGQVPRAIDGRARAHARRGRVAEGRSSGACGPGGRAERGRRSGGPPEECGLDSFTGRDHFSWWSPSVEQWEWGAPGSEADKRVQRPPSKVTTRSRLQATNVTSDMFAH